MTEEQKKSLNEKIAKTLSDYANEDTATSSQGFDIIRWARQGYLTGSVK